ncbi:TetR/AcrR family transcriptional regulator [Nonomuraea sp. NBC_01738]|uniref:TetR/AcrR family transcriptional regulator n=1 Tax=Nonomuraea sp. NBC_01738 TaxID=2976003 RepID=UPI002E11870F|nr:TetR/AcrR family transcriptional regulator [Nonomuraea sp. NBC_01738]
MRHQLPILGQPAPERADAARNRQKIIDCANRMIAERGAAQLSLDEVAREACVGVGTVYRRFKDQAGLIFALIDEHERQFQAAFLSGPPPLGPGAPAGERVAAFLDAVVDYHVAQLDLFVLLEKGAGGFNGPYRVRHTHLMTLLAELRPDADPRFLADALLAPVSAVLVNFQRTKRGMTVEHIKTEVGKLVEAVSRGNDRR